TDPGHQLVHAEGLREVVVGSEIQRRHLVGLCSASWPRRSVTDALMAASGLRRSWETTASSDRRRWSVSRYTWRRGSREGCARGARHRMAPTSAQHEVIHEAMRAAAELRLAFEAHLLYSEAELEDHLLAGDRVVAAGAAGAGETAAARAGAG